MLLDLLLEIQEEVVSNCDGASLKNLACCSSECNELVKKRLWRSIEVTSSHLLNCHFGTIKELKRLSYVEALRFYKTENWDNAEKKIRQRMCANYMTIFEYCKPVVLHANFMPTNALDVIIKFDCLLELHLEVKGAGDRTLQKICQNLTGLRILSMCYNKTKLSDEGFIDIDKLTSLQELYLKGAVITNLGCSYICSLNTTLKKLSLIHCSRITDEGFQNISRLSRLEELVVNYCNIRDAGLSHVSKFVKLTKLDASGCTHIGDEGLSYISSLIMLDELILSGCGNITDTGISFMRSLTLLTKLNLCDCYQISDIGFSHVGTLTSLKELNLSGCCISDAGLLHLNSLVGLTKLDLSNCYSIGDITNILSLTTLEELNLSGCCVAGTSLSHMEKTFVKLKELNLSGCYKTNDE